MTVPAVLETRLQTAINAVDANTDLDLLIGLIDSGQRAGVSVGPIAVEVARRAGLVDSNTPVTTAAKLAAALFKIDYPSIDLWAGVNGGSGGGVEIGQIVTGYFEGNPKYLPATGSRYLVSAYPDIAPLLAAGSLPVVVDPVSYTPATFPGLNDISTTWRALEPFVDDDVIMVPTQANTNNPDSHTSLLNISTDGGLTWSPSLLKITFTPQITPDAASAGFSTTNTSSVLAICKRDSPGHYAAIAAPISTSSAAMYLILTDDYGVTWYGWWSTGTSVVPPQSSECRLFYRNSAFLFLIGTTAKYSINGGSSWSTLTDAYWTSGNPAIYTSMMADGTLAYAPNTTALRHFAWPATPAGWSTSLTFTQVTAKFATSVMRVKQCGSWFLAWSLTDDELYVSSSLLGTYTRNTIAGISQVRDAFEKNGRFYLLVSGVNGPTVLSATAALTLTDTAAITNTATPSWTAAVTNARWPLTSLMFGTSVGATTRILIKHGRDDLAEILSHTGAGNIALIASATPNSQQPNFCKKYGIWFCSMFLYNQVNRNGTQNVTDNGLLTLHYRSTDLKIWTPIGVGFGHIVAASDRLLRLDHLGVVQKSTDGLTWNTADVTQPVHGLTIVAARLFCAGALIYLYLSDSTSNSTNNVFSVSSNGGRTWTATTGITLAIGQIGAIKAPITFYKGKYYLFNPYWSSDTTSINLANSDTYRILSSTDGISWTAIHTSSIATGTTVPSRIGWMIKDGVLFLSTGSVTSGSVIVCAISEDGVVFVSGTPAQNSNLLTFWNTGSVIDYDVTNSEGYWTIDSLTAEFSNGLNQRITSVYKGQELLFRFLHAFTSGLPVFSCFGGSEEEFLFANTNGFAKFDPDIKSFGIPVPVNGSNKIPLAYMRAAN